MRPERSLVLLLALAVTGCASPRFVRVDGDGGVVAIPCNSNSWPTYYREKAEKLIQDKCPNGYEIVREEEVVTGHIVHTDSQTTTEEAPMMNIGGVNGQSDKKKGERGRSSEDYSESFGGISVPLGETQQNTAQTTSYQDVTEWRIHYRKK